MTWPEVRVKVTEHQAQQRACGCGQTTTASFPAGWARRWSTGQACGRWSYLLVGQHLPVERAPS